MIHIALRSEYSFKSCFGHLKQLVDDAVSRGDTALGLADVNNTFGHVKFEKYCKDAGIKPIFGVRLKVTDEIIKARSAYQSCNYMSEFIFIAKNSDGLIEINRLVNKAYDNFYYIPRLLPDDIYQLSNNVIILAEYLWPKAYLLSYRINYKIESPARVTGPESPLESEKKRPIFVDNNRFSAIEEKPIYELLSSPKTELQTYSQHILSFREARLNNISIDAINETHLLANEIEHVKIKHAEMVKYKGSKSVYSECITGALKRNIDLNNPIYSERLQIELELINERNFGDYFLIVSDVLVETKKDSLVGPGRGSSGGSLVCYLMGITEIDPIKYGLLFERFIDINRKGLPDIDTDIPDIKRQKTIRYLVKKYGKDNVRSIGTVSTFQPKIAIGEFAKAMAIPAYDTEEIKDSIIERSSGDARSSMCILDTLTGTESGKDFIEKYPEMKIVSNIEGHARHSGKHAAGVIVANNPLYKYGGINSKENIIMMDGKEAEGIGLLKIDILGLRTLSVLEETANLAGFDVKTFYEMKLDDKDTFKIFNDGRLYGIFQFEGKALGIVTKQMGVESFEDICAITSLGRPGALNSGGTAKYIKRRIGIDEVEFHGKVYDNITKNTYGIVIYQEQTMMILKQFGNLSWGDVDTLRRAISKSYGDEFFAKYKKKFISGGIENGYSEEEAESVWKAVASMGSYGFNKSHAVAYSMISYWTAWCKAHYPLEFAAANLNHAKDDETAVKILRDFVVNDEIEYISIDPDESDINWSIKDGKLLGGLTNIHGIGIRKAEDIKRKRENNVPFTPSIAKKLLNPITPFDILFPTNHYFGKLYTNPADFGLSKPPIKIVDVNEPGVYTIIGIVTERDLRDRNDVQSVMKRGHKIKDNQFYLNLYIEDDTDSIKCMIPPFLFDELNGQELAEKSIPGETWYIIKGKVRDQWRSISIDSITNLKETIGMVAANA